MVQERRAAESDDRARLTLPQLRLDDLLAELHARLDAARGTRDRVHALLEAVVSIGGELDLETVLRRITEAATALAEARYGALGVIDEDGERLVQFVTVGMDEADIARIDHWPHGHGILGLLIKEPHPLRLTDLATHPESHGFPADHPPMSTFLGVPIRVRDEVFGNLYLTEKAGGGAFEEEDEVIVTALATAAGIAIENARLYDEARRRERWLEASAEISTALLSGTDPQDVTSLVAERARQVAGATMAAVALADESGEAFEIVAVDGPDAQPVLGLRIPGGRTVVDAVYATGRPQRLADGAAVAAEAGAPPGLAVGPLLIVPLGLDGSARGVIAVANGRGEPEFTDAVQRLLEAFAGQAAIALELAARRRDTERLALLEDRDRIAKDLHDTVIQRLFATAMTLMSTVRITENPEVGTRVRRAVDDLDGTIQQIRSTIFALQRAPGDDGLRARLYDVVEAAAHPLGFAPAVRVDGPLDNDVPEEVGGHLLAVASEALSNIARHADAASATVSVEVGADLVLRVEDDGRGISPVGRRSGLRNMEERAHRLGGRFSTADRPGGGTLLEWRVPLHDAA
ncbi:GAF domain-containing protein [Actinomadura flavalba]|uniref:sensor histidine kinase n=1 Tax=Actinomadura flavalba TaxID=1120938 RepID=UPI000368BA99|nr:GAF domain-containing protein [Actinomadura flavalba]